MRSLLDRSQLAELSYAKLNQLQFMIARIVHVRETARKVRCGCDRTLKFAGGSTQSDGHETW